MPSTYTNYDEINSLEEFSFIGGTDFTIEFTTYQSDGVTPQDIGGATITWMLSPYGENYNVLEISGSITGQYTFEVVIPGESTESFSGKYIQQLKIESFTNELFRPAQGVILIIPAIPTN